MTRKLALLLTIGAALAGSAPAQAHCLTVTGFYSLDLNLANGVTITIAEETPVSAVFFPIPAGVCDDGLAETTPDGYLEITQGGEVLCRNDALDPSFDPFAFGAGLHDMSGDCGGDYSAASITNPILPDSGATTANPPSATVATTRDVITEIPGSYKVNGETFELPQDTPGVSRRAFVIATDLA